MDEKKNRELMDDREDGRGNVGSFAGFVLLSDVRWDKGQFKKDLYEEWGIEAVEDQEDEQQEAAEDSLVFSVGEMMAAVSLMPAPVPDHEAEDNAANNYMWPQAVEKARAHQAHLLVAVLGRGAPLLERGKLFVKLAATCCKQQNVLGVYTSGTVFQPEFYLDFAGMMRDDELPIFNWIWFGLYRNERGTSAYTYGMDMFGKDEMEVLNTDAQPSDLRDFLSDIVSYVLEADVTLRDGETIGFSADQQLPITRGPGVSLPGITLKIGYDESMAEIED